MRSTHCPRRTCVHCCDMVISETSGKLTFGSETAVLGNCLSVFAQLSRPPLASIQRIGYLPTKHKTGADKLTSLRTKDGEARAQHAPSYRN